MKRVYIATNPMIAHLIKGLLKSESIESLVQGEFLWSAHGEVPITPETSPSVWIVDDDEFDRAREIICQFQAEKNERDCEIIEWKCQQCGEASEGQFTECWQCGALRP